MGMGDRGGGIVPRVSVKVEGGPELIAKLRKMGVDVDQVLEAAATAGAQMIAETANGKAPRRLIRTETAERRAGRVTVDVGMPDEVWYWRYLETGAGPHGITGSPLMFEGDQGTIVTGAVSHPGMAARPFLRPAFDAEKDNAADETGKVIKKQALR
jgi:HK97 gp10 family phage protein